MLRTGSAFNIEMIRNGLVCVCVCDDDDDGDGDGGGVEIFMRICYTPSDLRGSSIIISIHSCLASALYTHSTNRGPISDTSPIERPLG